MVLYNRKLGGLKSIMSDKQQQKAGDNSQQFQVQTMIVNNGIEEKRAREIFQEMFDVARKDLTQEAREIAIERVGKFEDDLIPKIEKIEGAINAFADPDFQFALTSAHKTAAATERENDYELLSELLIHRVHKKGNKNSCAGISRAIEIVDDISDDALLGLTVCFAVQQYTPLSGNITEGLSVLDGLFGKIGVQSLPNGMEWLDHLDILDAIRVSTVSSLRKYEEHIHGKIPGYFVGGIKKESEEYIQAIDLLNNNGLPIHILCDHELNQDYLRLEVPSEGRIKDISLIKSSNTADGLKIIETPLTDKQCEVLQTIYKMCANNTQSQQIIKENFSKKIKEYNNLCIIKDWWNSISSAFQITAVGRVLAHSNAKRIDNTLPDMD